MAVVLCASCEAEVGLSIIEAVIVYVVDDEIVGGVHYPAVHANGPSACVFCGIGIALCVKGAGIF